MVELNANNTSEDPYDPNRMLEKKQLDTKFTQYRSVPKSRLQRFLGYGLLFCIPIMYLQYHFATVPSYLVYYNIIHPDSKVQQTFNRVYNKSNE